MASRAIHKIPDDYSKRIGAFVRTERESRGLSLRELAAVTGMTHGNLGRLERGEIASPPFDVVCKLARVLGVEVDEFIRVASSSSNRRRTTRRHRVVADLLSDRHPLSEEDAQAVRAFLDVLRNRAR